MSVPSSDDERNVTEIDADFAKHGFPEINRLWKIAKRKKYHEKPLAEAKIQRARRRHMAILFGHPWLSLLLIFTSSALMVWYGVYLLGLLASLPQYFTQKHFEFGQIDRARFSLERGFFFALSFTALVFLLLMFSGFLQRYIFWPFDKLMARELAFMLRKQSWRTWLREQDGQRLFYREMIRGGVNRSWDDPEYVRRYKPEAEAYVSVPVLTLCEIVMKIIREFVGQKDALTRKFVPGRYLPQLLKGKDSVTSFVKENSEAIAALKEEDLNKAECLALLASLRSFVRPESSALEILDRRIAAIKEDVVLDEGEVQAEIWQREPLFDLTHQEEFFSSASLRGVKLMGRGARGRMSPFCYLWNRAISALDFRTRKGRVVRARIGVAEMKRFEGMFVLFVDGVEGSNSLSTTVIEKAILEYAYTCGFRYVVYNALVHNKIPRRFLKYLAGKGLRAQEIELKYVENAEREYLDAFGFPLQPFEYQRPSGRVVAYAVNALSGQEVILGANRTRRNRLWQFVRMNCYWILMISSSVIGVIIGLMLAPLMAVGLLVAIAPLLFLHLRYHRKALRTQN